MTKIISERSAGEQPRRPARITLRVKGLRAYTGDSATLRTACWTVARGACQIVILAYRWCAAAPVGDRWWRVTIAAGAPAAVVYIGCQHAPTLTPGLACVAVLAASAYLGLRTPQAMAPAAADGPAEPDPQERAEAVRVALLQLLEVHTRGRNGIHLRELHQILTRTRAYRTLPWEGVAPLLQAHQIPYQRVLSVGGIAGRSGVRRAAVMALLQARSPEGDQDHSQREQSGSDLRESQAFSSPSQPTLSPSRATE